MILAAVLAAATALAHESAPASTAGLPVLPRIRAAGTSFVDEAGAPVRLRGINLGNWLIMEGWIMELLHGLPRHPEIPDERALWALMAKRFGPERALRLAEAHHEAWISHADFVQIARAGFTFVRIPVWHAWLDGEDLPRFPGPPAGWRWLDLAVSWARHSGLRVIIDLHGAPGSQNEWDHSGVKGRNRLFTSRAAQDATVALWARIAERYRGQTNILGYDLLNEPRGGSPAGIEALHARLYDAIRAKDPDTLIFVEDGLHGLDTMPPPARHGWTNVAYEIHFYIFEANSDAPHAGLARDVVPKWRAKQLEFGVPLYLGEFNTINPDWGIGATRRYVEAFEANGWAWSPWTWKKIEWGAPPSLWGVLRNAEPWKDYVDVRSAPWADIVRYFHAHASRALRLNEPYREALLGP